MGVDEEPGLTELLLEAGERGTGRNFQKLVKAAIVPIEQGRRGDLDVLPSGTKPNDPARLLAGEGLDAVIERRQGDGLHATSSSTRRRCSASPTRARCARCATSLLFVARLDRITLDTVIDARDVLDRLDVPAIGCVPIGTRSEASPYYMGLRTPALEDA